MWITQTKENFFHFGGTQIHDPQILMMLYHWNYKTGQEQFMGYFDGNLQQ